MDFLHLLINRKFRYFHSRVRFVYRKIRSSGNWDIFRGVFFLTAIPHLRKLHTIYISYCCSTFKLLRTNLTLEISTLHLPWDFCSPTTLTRKEIFRPAFMSSGSFIMPLNMLGSSPPPTRVGRPGWDSWTLARLLLGFFGGVVRCAELCLKSPWINW